MYVYAWWTTCSGGLVGENDHQRYSSSAPFQAKNIENWGNQMIAYPTGVKQERSCESGYVYGPGNNEEIIHASESQWGHMLQASSPKSCVTTIFSSNMLDFSNSKGERKHHQPADNSSEVQYICNSM